MIVHRILAGLTACLALAAPAAIADDGVTKDRILLGQACALKGPAAALGTGMQAGLNAAFTRVNAAGGVNGRKVELKTINDGYEPDKCQAAVKALIESDKVFAVIGGVGTPTAKVAVPLCDAAKVPFIAPFTGAEMLRNPYNANVINLRASYFQEMEAIASHLVDQKKFTKVALMYQNDPYGQAGLAGIEKALTKRNMKLVASGTYERNTVAVADALKTVGASSPEAVVLVGTYKACAQFIKLARENPATKSAVFANISFVGTDALVSELGGQGEGVIVSQVVPYPWNESIPVVKDYLADMKTAGSESEIGFVSLEGYLAGRMFCQVVSKIDGEPTREKLVAAFKATTSLDLGGVTLAFGDNDNQGMNSVFMTVIQGGKCVPMTGTVAGVDTNH